MTRVPAIGVALLLLATLGLSGCAFLISVSGIPNIREMREVTLAPAADFQLTTRAGQKLELADLRGKVVVLTFLDAGCSADCRAFTGMVKEASAQMDYYQEAGRAAFLAVTAAPDKEGALLGGLEGMPQNFYILTGSPEDVAQVRAHYEHIGDETEPARLVLIDTKGRFRAYRTGLELKAADLRHNIRVLLSEQNLLARPLCH